MVLSRIKSSFALEHDVLSPIVGSANATIGPGGTTITHPALAVAVAPGTGGLLVQFGGGPPAPPGPPADPILSTMVIGDPAILDDGIATTTVTVTLLDSGSLPCANKTVTLSGILAGTDPEEPSNATISWVSNVTDLSGVVVFTVSDTVAETSYFKAIDTTDGITVDQQEAVTFATPRFYIQRNNTTIQGLDWKGNIASEWQNTTPADGYLLQVTRPGLYYTVDATNTVSSHDNENNTVVASNDFSPEFGTLPLVLSKDNGLIAVSSALGASQVAFVNDALNIQSGFSNATGCNATFCIGNRAYSIFNPVATLHGLISILNIADWTFILDDFNPGFSPAFRGVDSATTICAYNNSRCYIAQLESTAAAPIVHSFIAPADTFTASTVINDIYTPVSPNDYTLIAIIADDDNMAIILIDDSLGEYFLILYDVSGGGAVRLGQYQNFPLSTLFNGLDVGLGASFRIPAVLDFNP